MIEEINKKARRGTAAACFWRSVRWGWACYIGSAILAGLVSLIYLLLNPATHFYFGAVVAVTVPLCWVFAAPLACMVILPHVEQECAIPNHPDSPPRPFRGALAAFLGNFCVCTIPVLVIAGLAYVACKFADAQPGESRDALVWAVLCIMEIAGACASLGGCGPAFFLIWGLGFRASDTPPQGPESGSDPAPDPVGRVALVALPISTLLALAMARTITSGNWLFVSPAIIYWASYGMALSVLCWRMARRRSGPTTPQRFWKGWAVANFIAAVGVLTLLCMIVINGLNAGA